MTHTDQRLDPVLAPVSFLRAEWTNLRRRSRSPARASVWQLGRISAQETMSSPFLRLLGEVDTHGLSAARARPRRCDGRKYQSFYEPLGRLGVLPTLVKRPSVRVEQLATSDHHVRPLREQEFVQARIDQFPTELLHRDSPRPPFPRSSWPNGSAVSTEPPIGMQR
jgi:hypothetical protein